MPTVIAANPQRTVLIVQNLDTVAGTDWLYMADERGQVSTTGVQIAPIGGSITLRRTHGEEPEKTWYLVAATAACPVRVVTLFGSWTPPPEEPGPQEPYQPLDAPDMKREKYADTGYR